MVHESANQEANATRQRTWQCANQAHQQRDRYVLQVVAHRELSSTVAPRKNEVKQREFSKRNVRKRGRSHGSLESTGSSDVHFHCSARMTRPAQQALALK